MKSLYIFLIFLIILNFLNSIVVLNRKSIAIKNNTEILKQNNFIKRKLKFRIFNNLTDLNDTEILNEDHSEILVTENHDKAKVFNLKLQNSLLNTTQSELRNNNFNKSGVTYHGIDDVEFSYHGRFKQIIV